MRALPPSLRWKCSPVLCTRHRHDHRHHPLPRHWLLPSSLSPSIHTSTAIRSSSATKPNHLEDLAADQLAAVTAPANGTPISVVAGPGSGKTRVLTARVAHLMRECNVSPSNLLVITFTNKAAEELVERLQALIGDEAKLITTGTFHRLAVRLLRADIRRLPSGSMSPRFKINDEDESRTLISKILRRMESNGEQGAAQSKGAEEESKGGAPKKPLVPQSNNVWLNGNVKFIASGNTLEGEFAFKKQDLPNKRKALVTTIYMALSVVHQVLPTTYGMTGQQLAQKLAYMATDDKTDVSPVDKNLAMQVQQRLHMAKTSWRELGTFMELYRRECCKGNYMDFDSLLSILVAVMQHVPDVLDKHVLVDEFQDVNAAQFEIVRLLTERSGNLFAVGDPAQAIYGWRGSNPHFMRKHLHTVHPVLNQHALTVNYRSLPKVVDVAERLWDRFPSQFPHYGKLSANRVHGAGTVVETKQYQSISDEALAIARRCREMIDKQIVGPGDIAVLVRRVLQQGSLEVAMTRYNIPYRLVGGKQFTKYKSVRVCLAYLRLAVFPENDELALDEIINTPTRKLGPKTIGQLQAIAQAEGVSMCGLLLEDLLDWQGAPPEKEADMPLPPLLAGHPVANATLNGIRNLRYVICSMRAACMEGAPLGQPLREMLRLTNYLEMLRDSPKKGRARGGGSDDENNSPDIAVEKVKMLEDRMEGVFSIVGVTEDDFELVGDGFELVDLPLGSRPINTAILEYMLQNIALAEEETSLASSRGDVVTISTMHGAKGLEWDVVFVPGMVRGIFPTVDSDDVEDRATLEKHMEERRLCYVAYTRAKNLLVRSYFPERPAWMHLQRGESFECIPSEFLRDDGSLPAHKTRAVGTATPMRTYAGGYRYAQTARRRPQVWSDEE